MAEIKVEVPPLEFHALGRIAFEAYNAAGANPGKTFDGREVPTWEALTDDVREKWQAGASECFKRLATAADIAIGTGDIDDFEAVEELQEMLESVITNGLPSAAAVALVLSADQITETSTGPTQCELQGTGEPRCVLIEEHAGPCHPKGWPEGSEQAKRAPVWVQS